MNISPGEEIAGVSAVEIRKFFRKFSTGFLNVNGATFCLGVSVQKAKKVMVELENQGFLKSEVKRLSEKRESWWEQTVKEAALRMASATPQIKRSTADRMLSQLLVRVNEVNNSDKFL